MKNMTNIAKPSCLVCGEKYDTLHRENWVRGRIPSTNKEAL